MMKVLRARDNGGVDLKFEKPVSVWQAIDAALTEKRRLGLVERGS